MYLCVGMSMQLPTEARDVGSPGAGVRDSCRPEDVRAGTSPLEEWQYS